MSTALVGGTIYVDPTEVVPDGVVLLHGETIAAVGTKRDIEIPSEAHVIDCTGRVVTAGFWNSHVHFFERKWRDAANAPAEELTRQLHETLTCYGFTTVFDLSSHFENTRALRDRIASGEVIGPRILTTGVGLIPPGSLPNEQVLMVMGLMEIPLPEVADATQAAEAARKNIDAGVDGIKVFASPPRLPPVSEEVVRAAADEAHRAGKPMFMHANSAADVTAALRGGVDVLAHTTPHSGPWDASILELIRGRALTPTLTLWRHYLRHDRISVRERAVRTAIEQLRTWRTHGGTILFGTDLGAVDPDPAEEYSLMAEAGMDFREILASLTTAPAAQFGVSNECGRVAAGLRADLVVLNGEDVSDVQCVIRGGEMTGGLRRPGPTGPDPIWLA